MFDLSVVVSVCGPVVSAFGARCPTQDFKNSHGGNFQRQDGAGHFLGHFLWRQKATQCPGLACTRLRASTPGRPPPRRASEHTGAAEWPSRQRTGLCGWHPTGPRAWERGRPPRTEHLLFFSMSRGKVGGSLVNCLIKITSVQDTALGLVSRPAGLELTLTCSGSWGVCGGAWILCSQAPPPNPGRSEKFRGTGKVRWEQWWPP